MPLQTQVNTVAEATGEDLMTLNTTEEGLENGFTLYSSNGGVSVPPELKSTLEQLRLRIPRS